MASTPEKKVKDKVTKLLKSMGIYYFSPATHGFGRSGVPDLICCLDGLFIGIECKANGNIPTALQEKEMQAIRTAGGITFVANEETTMQLPTILEAIRKTKGKAVLKEILK